MLYILAGNHFLALMVEEFESSRTPLLASRGVFPSPRLNPINSLQSGFPIALVDRNGVRQPDDEEEEGGPSGTYSHGSALINWKEEG